MSERYPIIWVYTQFTDCNQKKEFGYAGFCGKTNRLYHVSKGLLEPMVIHDFIVSKDGRCEEECGCLNLSCPLNRTTAASYGKRHGLKGRPPKKWNPVNLELPEWLRGCKGGSIATGKGDCGPALELVSMGNAGSKHE
jgi:hypothetical protein